MPTMLELFMMACYLMPLSLPTLQMNMPDWLDLLTQMTIQLVLKIPEDEDKKPNATTHCYYRPVSTSIIKFKHLKFINIKQETNDRKVISLADQKKNVFK